MLSIKELCRENKRCIRSWLVGSVSLATLLWGISPSWAAPYTNTIPLSIHGVTVWVRAYNLKGQSLPLIAGNGWWKLHGVNNVAYSFAFGQTNNVWLVIKFRQFATHDQAIFFASGPHHPALRVASVQHNLSITNALPTAILTSKDGGWQIQGRTNYNLTETVWAEHDLATTTPGASPPYQENVGGSHGIPHWEVSRAMGKRYQSNTVHNFGYGVFGATKRMVGAPPFTVQPGLIPTFPYFNIGYLPGDGVANANWFTINPNPLFFNVLGFALEQFPFVGFEYAGIYSINSYSPPPHVDFESPFAFYGYQPGRLADMVFREENFPPGDVGGLPPANIQRTLFRLSWKTHNPQFWEYSLQLAGFYQDHRVTRIGPAKFYALSSASLPSVLSKRWPWVTFVQLGSGYPGSEGNYFYGGSGSPAIWNWLGGLSPNPTPYLTHPYLLPTTALTDSSHRGLPIGYRGEYSDNYFHKPKLYISPIDKLIHLMNAQGGLWNLGHRLILRTRAIGGSAYQNVWLLQQVRGRLASDTWSSHTIDALYDLSPFLLSVTPTGITLKHPTSTLQEKPLSPPQGKIAWTSFAHLSRPFQIGRPPRDLSSWIQDFKGPEASFPQAKLIRLSLVPRGIKLWIRLSRLSNASKLLGPQATHLIPGIHLLQYVRATRRWIVSTATPAHLELTRADWATPHLFTPDNSWVIIKNSGSIPWTGVVKLKDKQNTIWSHQATVAGHTAGKFSVYWVPNQIATVQLTLTADRHILDHPQIVVQPSTRPWMLRLTSSLKTLLITGLLGMTIIIWAIYAWRRIAWTT